MEVLVALYVNETDVCFISIMTLTTLNIVLNGVVNELQAHGFWTPKIRRVSVILVPCFWLDWTTAAFYEAGEIYWPRLDFLSRNSPWDILRHEYGHALVDHYGSKILKAKLLPLFDPKLRCGRDHDCLVSSYAGTDAEENFCETLAAFLRRDDQMQQTGCQLQRARWNKLRELGVLLNNR